MYNLFKILAIGIAVIKARISFQLVLMMPLFYMLVATRHGFQCDRHLHSVHTFRTEQLPIRNYSRRNTPVKNT